MDKLITKINTKVITQNSIYFVTCIQTKTKRAKSIVTKKFETYLDTTRTRCWGWYINLKDAIKDVEHNYTDIAEDGYYDYCIIEQIPEMIFPITTKQIKWFKFNIYKELYQECEKPKWAEGIMNWAF